MDQVAELRKDLGELANHVMTIAKAVYSKEGMAFEDEEDIADIAPVEDKGMYADKAGEYGEDPMDDNMMPYDEEDEDAYMERARNMYRMRKGYAGTAQSASDEEDAKFDEKDSDIKGNEASPAGEQGGNREDESFGPGGMAYKSIKADISKLTNTVNKLAQAVGGEVVASSVVPGVTDRNKVDKAQPTLTREMQEQAKQRSFRDLNRLREEVGDLPRNLIGG